MATIRLNNIIKPRNTNNPVVLPETVKYEDLPTYTDLHLDMVLEKTVGIGNAPRNAGDIKVDTDIEAIKNAIRNIFSTRKGQKILTPAFGTNLDQYLFEEVSEFQGSVIGNEILRNLNEYEPRIETLKVQVYPDPDQNLYRIQVVYRFLEINKTSNVILSIGNDGQIIL